MLRAPQPNGLLHRSEGNALGTGAKKFPCPEGARQIGYRSQIDA